MVLSPAFEKALEDEIESRVNERVTKILELISRNYKIKYSRLLSDVALMPTETPSSCCCGVTKSGKRCQRSGKYDGYCKNHMTQKPDIRMVTRSASSKSSPPKVVHTHTLPPLFMKGCPACETAKVKSSAIFGGNNT
jgi:hypothetical protein